MGNYWSWPTNTIVTMVRNFLYSQAYVVTGNIIYQDNMSDILLENNGKSSRSKRTKHINIRFFLVTDRIHKWDMSVEWFPRDEMTRDLLTKTNQGSKFKRFRDFIMIFMPKIYPSNGKQGNRNKKQTNKSKK